LEKIKKYIPKGQGGDETASVNYSWGGGGLEKKAYQMEGY
jgi:hypothetical protein